MNWQPKHRALQALIRAFGQEAAPLYIVGGAVRDFLLGRASDQTDIDLVVEREAVPVARRVADRLGWAFYPLDAERDVARLVFNTATGKALVCDVAALRGGSLAADLRLRDFTVNALAFLLEQDGSVRLVDVCNGVRDLEQRQLRRVTATSLADDPVRLLRAIRFMHQLRFTLEDETATQVKRMGTTVKLASPERIRDELWKVLTTRTPAGALTDLRALGLLSHVLPEVALLTDVEQSPPHDRDVFAHTVSVVEQAGRLRDWLAGGAGDQENAAPAWNEALAGWRTRLYQHFAQPLAIGRLRREWLVWHALLHDIGKPTTRTVQLEAKGVTRIRFLGHEQVGAELAGQRLEALRFSRHEIVLSQAVVGGHMRPHQLHADFAFEPISRRAAYRFFRDVGGRQFSQLAGVDTVLLALADLAGTNAALPPDWPDYLAHATQLLTFAFANDGLQKTQRQPILDGHTLMQRFRLEPGRRVGEILEHVLEAQAAGEVKTLDDALALADRWLTDHIN